MSTLFCFFVLLLGSLSFFQCVSSQSVAPDDANPFCSDIPIRNVTFPNEKILLDSQNYRSTFLVGAEGQNGTWLTIDYDGGGTGRAAPFADAWFEGNQGVQCLHRINVCADRIAGGSSSFQSNWLITQYINISEPGISQLRLNVTFSSNLQCGNQCGQQTYEVQTFQTDEPDEMNRGNISYYSYAGLRLIQTAVDRATTDSEPFAVSSSGLYLAILDQGSCTVINRIVVFYNICPYQVFNKAIYPETVAPQGNFDPDKGVNATCIDNASPTSSNSLSIKCRILGVWVGSASCQCNAGYEANDTVCQACQQGTYKSAAGDSDCNGCPNNTFSASPGSVSCQCLSGYYRAPHEDVAVSCTAPPSSPQNLTNTSVTATIISISWLEPAYNGGRTDLYYVISINSSINIVEYSTVHTNYTLMGLIPFTTYEIQVIARNGVSDQDNANNSNRTVTITVTTHPTVPSRPRNVRVSEGSLLTWSDPMELFGSVLVEYLVLSNPLNDSSSAVARVRLPPAANSYDLTDLNVPNGFYYIWVQAVSKVGKGEFSTSVLYNRSNSFMNPTLPTVNNEPLILSVSFGALVLIILIVLVNALLWIVLVIKRKRKQKKKKEQSSYIDPIVNPSYQMTTATMASSPIALDNVAYNTIPEAPHLNSLNPNEKFYEEIDDIAIDTAATAPSTTPTYLEVF